MWPRKIVEAAGPLSGTQQCVPATDSGRCFDALELLCGGHKCPELIECAALKWLNLRTDCFKMVPLRLETVTQHGNPDAVDERQPPLSEQHFAAQPIRVLSGLRNKGSC